MFRIRRIYDTVLPVNQQAISQVQAILTSQFPDLNPKDINKLPDQLTNPLKYRFRSILSVAEGSKGDVKGFALLLHAADLNFCYLEYVSAAEKMTGRGIGGALYERIRNEARALGVLGIFMECLPDDPEFCRDPTILAQNKARLKFYEQYGARPITGSAYETPVKEGDDNPPYLVFDGLGDSAEPSQQEVKKIVRAILERKYAHLCPQTYIDMVVDSFTEDPVQLRGFRYVKKPISVVEDLARPVVDRQIALIVNDQHDIHHIRERGYVESPVRIRSILKEIEPTGLFYRAPVRRFAIHHLKKIHAADFVDYLKLMCSGLPEKKALYPYVFPIRNATRPPREKAIKAGYYCIDTFTPLTRNVYPAAKRAADCAMTAARLALAGQHLSYALVRPPGHHAEHRAFGGFCYFNNAAVAAQELCLQGKVAIIDIDYHHGNGTQNIFYRRSDVLTVSLHGHPRSAYPYFNGFEDETGEGEGKGFNMNIPLPEQLDGEGYATALDKALRRIKRFKPTFLVIALGLDTATGDPTGTWSLKPADFFANGRKLGGLGLPTLVIQEGGYDNRSLGKNARQFFQGLWEGSFGNVRPALEKTTRSKRSS
ncbi:histone deacetylase family protein [Pelobacter sp. M08fum]|uniref:Histone deacetylase family protein n=2 Tax=Pelovirga terrestris TaxID=2771352 RepID=A0A8J6QN36_9BACT|nr:histone deacetylase family protein [Pelovirga terrestris]